MKSVGQSSQSLSPDLQKATKQEIAAKPTEQSPYLKAVLSERKNSDTARVLSMANSSMAAALRYIANSSKQALPGKLVTPAW